MSAERRENVTCYIVAGLFVGLFLFDWVATQPLLHWENFYYMPYLGGDEGKGCFHEFLKIFNIPAIDAPIARFRPIGHLFELFDAKLVTHLNPYVPLGFRSVMHLILVAGSVPLLARGFQKIFAIWPKAFTWACAAYFCAFPHIIVMNSVYFRPVKTLAAFMLAFLFWMWASYRSISMGEIARRRGGVVGWILLTLTASLLCFGDELCSVIVLLFLGLALLEAVVAKRVPAFLVTMFTAAVVAWAVTKFFAPWSYDHLIASPIDRRWSDLSKGLKFDRSLAGETVTAVFYQFTMIFGNAPQYAFRWPFVLSFAAMVGFALGTTLGHHRSRLDRTSQILIQLGLPVSMGVILGTTYLMASFHHPTVTLQSQNTGYYNVPTSLLLYLGTVVGLGGLGVFDGSKCRRVWIAVLVVCAIFGVLSLKPLRAITYPDQSPTQSVSFWTLSALVGEITRGQYTPASQWSRLTPGGKYFLEFYEGQVLRKGISSDGNYNSPKVVGVSSDNSNR